MCALNVFSLFVFCFFRKSKISFGKLGNWSKNIGFSVSKYSGPPIVFACILGKNSIAKCEKLKLSHKSQLPTKDSKTNQKDNSNFDWNIFIRLLLPDLWLFTLASLTALAVAIVNIKLPHLLGELINAITSLTQDQDVNNTAFNVLYKPSIKLIWNFSLQAGLTFLYITLLSSFGERFAARLRIALFDSLINQDIAFFDAHKTGEIVNRYMRACYFSSLYLFSFFLSLCIVLCFKAKCLYAS